MLDTIIQYLDQYEELFIMIGVISAAIFVLTLLLTPYLLGLMPVDYFSSKPKNAIEIKSVWGFVKFIVTTVIGVLLVLAGIIMLVTPGQGVISILLGLFLLEFPGKRELELKFISHTPTYKTLNWLRHKAGKPPFNR
ncbi:PGPGW domain-containing protein [Candidatus Thioglobus sp.]|nr:PGPGW domain-containing protein [Candidatus Thioglobus sp.]MDB3869498.1 PGPGW domain-containing protein [Candidatus Thioglobus sp.]MDB3893823.1 PGPGW domain-containing protein [Candidatus Thioglobus sp.]MDC0388696.1 PGPGW domain-containing protein [Candidatus Thioglobus sp.]MDC0888537.1 PGPGW domain-containing protein [Candidatus Thioglobus sp.]